MNSKRPKDACTLALKCCKLQPLFLGDIYARLVVDPHTHSTKMAPLICPHCAPSRRQDRLRSGAWTLNGCIFAIRTANFRTYSSTKLMFCTKYCLFSARKPGKGTKHVLELGVYFPRASPDLGPIKKSKSCAPESEAWSIIVIFACGSYSRRAKTNSSPRAGSNSSSCNMSS
jgi:hypothetical protein